MEDQPGTMSTLTQTVQVHPQPSVSPDDDCDNGLMSVCSKCFLNYVNVFSFIV